MVSCSFSIYHLFKFGLFYVKFSKKKKKKKRKAPTGENVLETMDGHST